MEPSTFKDACKQQGLNDKTINNLLEQDVNSIDLLIDIQPDDFDKLNISIGDKSRLKKWQAKLMSGGHKGSARLQQGETKFEGCSSISMAATSRQEQAMEQDADTNTTLQDADPSVMKKPDDVYIGVIGLARTGKSSLVNALRGVSKTDSTAAKVGLKHGGLMKRYDFWGSDHHYLWDLPGIDVADSLNNYLSKIRINSLDVVIFSSGEILDPRCLELAAIIHGLGKPFFTVRTKIDEAIEGDIDDYGADHNQAKLLHKIRKEIQGQLSGKGLPAEVHLVSSKPDNECKWELVNLRKAILKTSVASSHEIFNVHQQQSNAQPNADVLFDTRRTPSVHGTVLAPAPAYFTPSAPPPRHMPDTDYVHTLITNTALTCSKIEKPEEICTRVRTTLNEFDRLYQTSGKVKPNIYILRDKLEQAQRKYHEAYSQISSWRMGSEKAKLAVTQEREKTFREEVVSFLNKVAKDHGQVKQ